MRTSSARRSSGRLVLSILLALVLLAGAVTVGWWAGRATLSPQEEVSESGEAEVVWGTATSASVGRSLPLSTTLRQPSRTVAVNSPNVTGIVTAVHPGEVKAGETVYVVGDVPIRVVEGDRPFYRDLAEGAEGWDVQMLQQALIELDFLDASEPDGDFGPRTEDAVKEWQEDLGLEETGAIPLGRLIAVQTLPTVVQLGETIVVGQQVAGGADAVLAPTGERTFVLVITQEQARLVPAEATVEITYGDNTWPAVIAGSTMDELGATEFELTAPDGGPVCGNDCEELPGDAEINLRSEVIIVPRVEGIGVPAAAVHTRADQSTYVVTQDGETDVTVRESGQGLAIVEGVEEGTQVRVLGGGTTPVPGDDSTDTQEP